ncbi:MAG: hypothetical protein JWO44_2807 [Bacteroidetes bacterium]|nr:hypothetical protein [Bacteroidota bacterium]
MKKNYINGKKLLGGILLTVSSLAANAQMVTFQKHYPTTYDESGKDVYPTADGGYLIAATTENTIANDLDIVVIKTNSVGDILSTKTYGGNRVDYPNNMIPTSDGNFFIVGYSNSFSSGDQNIYLLKVNQAGDTLFTRVYGGYGNEEGKEIIATSDGNYAIVGASNSVSFTNNEMSLMKIDLNGAVLWTKYYGTSQYESARSVKLCPDGGFIISGKSSANPSAIASIMLVKTNPSGDTTWTKMISGGADSYEGKSILANTDGTYTIAIDDSSMATDSDVRIMKLDAMGGITWTKMYGGPDKDICKTIRSTTDGGYIVGAISRSFGWVNPDMWIIKLDANGDQSWSQHFGGTGHEHCYSARQTSDGGYIAVGHARSFSSSWEIYLVKTDAAGLVGIKEFESDSRLAVYPNPSNGIFNVDLSEGTEFSTFTITNTLGQTVYSENLEALRGNQVQTMRIDLQDNERGIYFVTMQSATHSITKKLILN